VFKWERAGILPAIVIPGIRAVRNRASDVRSLANSIAAGRLSVDQVAVRESEGQPASRTFER